MGLVACLHAEEMTLSQQQQSIFEDAKQFARNVQTKKMPLSTCSMAQNIPSVSALHETRATNPETRVLVFVSFSMGEAALQQYAQEAKKAGAALVFRGLVGDSMKTTVLRLQSLVQKTQASFLIDPPAFRRFGIDKVPAVVVVRDSGFVTREEKNTHPSFESRNPNPETRFDVVYGLTTLDYALEKISKDGETAAAASLALQKLRGKTG